MNDAIAIVGMACEFPEARSPLELWQNILARRRAFRKLPDARLRSTDYVDADPTTPDATYVGNAAVIEGYEFDRARFKIGVTTYRSTDLTHWLALDVASRALQDASVLSLPNFNSNRAGVIVGNTLTGEFSRASVMRLRWPYVRRTVDHQLAAAGWTPDQRETFLESLELQYKSPFPEVGEDTLAGGLSNTIAGRICNYFDWNGGGFTVDGACSSSLLATAQACSALCARDLDLALAGGVDLSLDPFELIGFAKTGALAPGMMRVFDQASAGFWPGEGCGFVVLMREADARAQGLRIHALIKGWGLSSDGAGGVTRPKVEGQVQAMRRAYQRAGYDPGSVGYFEGHGTGTAVGDEIELGALIELRRKSTSPLTPAALGSIKANIGHTKAAAGIASLIKATLAIESRTLPPITGCDTPHSLLASNNVGIHLLHAPQPWRDETPARASVSAMGFGGINVHVTLEEASPTSGSREYIFPNPESFRRSPADAEVFLFEAVDRPNLARQVTEILGFADQLAYSELADLSHALTSRLGGGSIRAAVVASSPQQLRQRLEILHSSLNASSAENIQPEDGVFLSSRSEPGRICFLFPGQGSPSHRTGGCYPQFFPSAGSLCHDSSFPVSPASETLSTAEAQPAIVRASLVGLHALRSVGILGHTAIGHSLGELVALHWAGVYDQEALMRLARVRGNAMESLGDGNGRMAAISASAEQTATLQNGHPVAIVGYNSTRQTVVAGDISAISTLVARAKAQGWRATLLPVRHAFHTEQVASAASPLAAQLQQEALQLVQRPVVSTVTGQPLSPSEDIPQLLCRQLTSPVRFINAVQAVETDTALFIEVGPGEVLSGLVRDFSKVPVVSLDASGHSLRGFQSAVAAVFVLGGSVETQRLFEGRFTRPWRFPWAPKFFSNPCESIPEPRVVPHAQGDSILPSAAGPPSMVPAPVKSSTRVRPKRAEAAPSALVAPGAGKPALEIVRNLIAAKAELPLESIRDDSRLLGDLHINSIRVGQLVSEAARQLGLSAPVGLLEFATVTVAQVGAALEQLRRENHAGLPAPQERWPAGLDSWTRPFLIDWIKAPAPLSRSQISHEGSDWTLFGHSQSSGWDTLKQSLARLPGQGVVVVCPDPVLDPSGEGTVRLLLEAARKVGSGNGSMRTTFVLVHHARRTGGFARTLHLERPNIAVRILQAPDGHPSLPDWIRTEVESPRPFVEAAYGTDGVRMEPRVRRLPASTSSPVVPIAADDVVLVTGGGKGIGAECALGLARELGVRLALLGRASPESDSELRANLDRLAANGIRFGYYLADVADGEQVRRAVLRAQAELGPIRGVLHAAGTNTPRLIESLDVAAFLETLRPKLDGLRHVLTALAETPPRWLVTFGSIIARTGLPGEADYAIANEWLAQWTEDYQRQHPECQCLALEWSAWSGTGMAQRLGRLEHLIHQGISPIPPATGVAWFLELLRRPPASVSVLVTGRYGNPTTLTADPSDLPFLRFLERIALHVPEVELIVESSLSLATDPYLADHVYHGELLFPAVAGLEAMAQVAMALRPSSTPPQFANARFLHPIVVPRDHSLTLRIVALQLDSDEIQVAVRTQATGYTIDHFTATCTFKPESLPSLPTNSDSSQADPSSAPPWDPDPGLYPVLLPAAELYEPLLFHTGRFRRITRYRTIRGFECVAEFSPEPNKPWFGPYLPARRVLPDTGARDACIHAIQACYPHFRLLPLGVKHWARRTALPPSTKGDPTPSTADFGLMRAWQTGQDKDVLHFNVEVRDPKTGQILESWIGLQLKKIEPIPRSTPWPPDLFASHLERRIDELWSVRIGCGLCKFDADTPRRARSSTLARRILGPDAEIRHRPDGKPEIGGGRHVSFSHADPWTVLAIGNHPIACDLEPVVERSPSEWRALLGIHYSLAEQLLSVVGGALHPLATRVWTCIESLKKAGAPWDAPLIFDEQHEDGWITLRSGRLRLVSQQFNLQTEERSLVLCFLMESDSR